MRINSTYHTVEDLDFFNKRAKEYKLKNFSTAMIERKNTGYDFMISPDRGSWIKKKNIKKK